MRPGRRTLASSLAGALALLGRGVSRRPRPTPAKARHEAMEQVGDAMKALGAIAKKQAPFDAPS